MKHITWNGKGYHSMVEVARLEGLHPVAFKRYYDMGLRSSQDIDDYHRIDCVVCNAPVPEGRRRYCSNRCRRTREVNETRKLYKPKPVIKKQRLTSVELNVLLALDDSDGYPRLLGSNKTAHNMALDGFVIEVGHGYYVMSQKGIELISVYKKGLS